jgi:drug/metabolite transporter (DMT)-like permease
LFAWVVIRHPLGARQLAGIGIGLAGLALTAVSSSGITGFEPIGAVAVLTSTAIWAGGSLLAHRMNLPADQTVSVTVQLLTAGVVLGASTLATGTAKSTNVGDLPATVWAALGFLTFFSTLVGYGLFTWLNTTASSTLANTYNYVSPVIAICLAASFLHEPLSWPKAGAAIVALLGVALMVTGSTAKAGSLDAPSQCQHLGASLTQTHSP